MIYFLLKLECGVCQTITFGLISTRWAFVVVVMKLSKTAAFYLQGNVFFLIVRLGTNEFIGKL